MKQRHILLGMIATTSLCACDLVSEQIDVLTGKSQQQSDNTAVVATAKNDNNAPVNMGITIYNGDVAYVAAYTQKLTQNAGAMSGVQFDLVDAKNDAANQMAQIDTFINQGKDVLLVNLVDTSEESALAVINKAKAKNIPVVFYHRYPGSKVLQNYDKAYFVGTKASDSGIIQGEMVVKNWLEHPEWDKNGDGVIQYVILKGKPGNADAEGRSQWVAATIQDYPSKGVKAEELEVTVANWQRAEAKPIVSEWLNGPLADKIEVIISNNDNMALGALDALEEAGKSLPVFGVDAALEVQEAIKADKIVGSVGQDVNEQSQAALNLAVNLVRGNDPATNAKATIVRQEMFLNYIGVDKSNVDTWGK